MRPATKGDLPRVATLQVHEYGGDGLLFFWHYLQELDRLQTSYWVDPKRHTMLVVEEEKEEPTETPPPSPFHLLTQALESLFLGPTRIVGFVDLDARMRLVRKSTYPPTYPIDLLTYPSRETRNKLSSNPPTRTPTHLQASR